VGHYDIAVVGAGAIGAAVAYFASRRAKVVVLEAEPQPGYHATGRSAAVLIRSYGTPCVRLLTRISHEFLSCPPPGFADDALLHPRGNLVVASGVERPALESSYASMSDAREYCELIDGSAARELCPILRPENAALALWEPGACDIDVDALLQGFLRGCRARGAVVATRHRVVQLRRRTDDWQVIVEGGELTAKQVVNAAGPWADDVARGAGVPPLGLRALRRTALLVDAPGDPTFARWPFVVDAQETIYFKPDAGKLLVSPADETPSAPCDAYPDDLDVAVAVDRLARLTGIEVKRQPRSWAGLRTFSQDRDPVMGFDEAAPGFLWAAGFGGFGVQTSAAAGMLAAALLAGQDDALDANSAGLLSAVSPSRFGPRTAGVRT
jgi:D-arginine dehydrogenase